MTNRRYVNLVLIVSITLIAGAALFNALIDPYSMFGSPRIAGLNSLKPYAGDRGRTAKIHQVTRIRPTTVIVGNSRPEMGLNPDLTCWPDTHKPVFNLALPGLTLYKQVRYSQHAIANSSVKRIFMGVDFSDFLTTSARHDPSLWPSPQESEVKLSVDAFARPRRRFAIDRFVDQFRASVSLGTLANSTSTIMLQRRQWLETRTVSGFNPAEGIYVPIVSSEGVRTLFSQKNQEMATRFAPAQTLFNDGTKWSSEFEALKRLGAQSQHAGIELVLFINPYHSEYLLLLDSAGHWPLFEQWKTQLVQTAALYDSPVWDFSTFDYHATELVSELPDKNKSLRWFWEPAHYRQELGTLMLSQMLEAPCHAEHASGFGVVLTEHNLPETLADIRARRDAFVTAQPAVRARLVKLLQEHRSGGQRSN